MLWMFRHFIFRHILAISQLIVPNLWRDSPLITVLGQSECLSFRLCLHSDIVVVHNTTPLLELSKYLKRPWRLLERIQVIHDLGPRSYWVGKLVNKVVPVWRFASRLHDRMQSFILLGHLLRHLNNFQISYVVLIELFFSLNLVFRPKHFDQWMPVTANVEHFVHLFL